MFDQFSDGYCPQCMLDGNQVVMILNKMDFWECPQCQLQAHTASAGMFALLKERGNGQLKVQEASKYVVGYVLTNVKDDDEFAASSEGFRSREDLQAFLEHEVAS